MTLTTNPGPLSRQFSAKTNASAWKGEPAGTVLCLGIEGESTDGEQTFRTDFTFAYDPLNLWTPGLRWISPIDGKPPKLSANQVKGQNGITFPVVQGQEEFGDLPI